MFSRWFRPLSDDDAVGVLIGVGLEQHAVDDAENRGVDADAERRGTATAMAVNAATLGQRAPGVAHIL